MNNNALLADEDLTPAAAQAGEAQLKKRTWREIFFAGWQILCLKRPPFLLLLLVLYALLLYLPIIQMSFGILPRFSLRNVGLPRHFPAFSLSDFISGSYQSKVENYLMKKSGLWGLLVRTDNQINYSLFNQVSGGYTSTVLLGKNGTLYETAYLDDWNGKRQVGDDYLTNLAADIKKLQDLLAARGVSFIFFITPSKVAVMPEDLPERRLVRGREKVTRNYERLLPMLSASGVNYLDSHEVLGTLENPHNLPLFPKPGTHWSRVASCPVSASLVKRFEQSLSKPLNNFSCGPDYELSVKPRGSDGDLVQMLNVWNAKPSLGVTAYPTSELRPSTRNSNAETFRPDILFVGNSFLWAVLEHLDRFQVYNRRNFYFYFKTNYFYNSSLQGKKKHGKRNIAIDKLNWEKDILSHDIIVLEVNEAVLQTVGNGFIKEALAKLAPVGAVREPPIIRLAGNGA